jgi:hypothetical protein
MSMRSNGLSGKYYPEIVFSQDSIYSWRHAILQVVCVSHKGILENVH